ncbi:MAG: hypothetical protein QM657_15580 [Lacrimispora sp.]|uniref:hypothetical protein n=1 Tax=Lacrimispora sp. TaxID=2719234 RepID=UPI0039E6A93F
MNQMMKDNLIDLMDIRKCMKEYYPIGQELVRQFEYYQNYQKAAERWKPENKMKYVIGSAVVGVVITPLILIGGLVAAGLYFGFDKIVENKQHQCDLQMKKVEELINKFEKSYEPVQEKCQRLLFSREDYETPMAVDYLIEIIESGRAETMKEAYNMLDEQLHRWKMEEIQNKQLEMQKNQIRQLKNIEADSAASASFSFINMAK